LNLFQALLLPDIIYLPSAHQILTTYT
jgi:hypothetical protein